MALLLQYLLPWREKLNDYEHVVSRVLQLGSELQRGLDRLEGHRRLAHRRNRVCNIRARAPLHALAHLF